MLETIREYAAERLEASGEAETLWRRHAEWFLGVARGLAPELAVSREWLDTIEREHDNLRAALDRLEAVGDTQFALQLAESQWRFWKTRGYKSEACQRLDRLLAADLRPTAARAHALNAAAGMSVDAGDHEIGRRQAEEALTLHRELGDAWGIARSLYMLGYAAIESGDWARAKPLFEEVLQRMEDLGAEHYALSAAFNLSWAYDELGDRERAVALDEESLRRARAAGNAPMETAFLESLSGRAREDGRLDDALRMLKRALGINRDLGDLVHQLDSLSRIAAVYAAAGDAVSATRLLSASLALHDERALNVPLYQRERNKATLTRIHAQLDDVVFAEVWQQGSRLGLDEAIALALDEPATANA